MWDWKNMYGPSVLSGIGMYWGLDLIQGWWSTEPVWQVKDCRLGQGRDGVVVSQGTAASQELCVEEEWVEKLEREVHSNESCLGGSVRWRCFMSWRSDGIWTWGGAVVQVTVQACFIQWVIWILSWGQLFYPVSSRMLNIWSTSEHWLNPLCAHSRAHISIWAKEKSKKGQQKS